MEDVGIGFVTTLGVDYRDALALAPDVDFDHVEILMNGRADRHHLSDDAVHIRGLATQGDIDLLVHLPFQLDVGSPFEHVRAAAVAELEAAIETAADLGATKGVLHPHTSVWPLAWDDDEVRAAILDAVNHLDRFGRERDFAVCPENLYGGTFPITDFDRLLAETDVGVTLDTGHARISGFDAEDLGAFVREHPDRISHLHLNDTRWEEDEHLPFGAGDYEFEQLFSALDDVGFSGTMSLEVFTPDAEYVAYSKQRLDRLLDEVLGHQ